MKSLIAASMLFSSAGATSRFCPAVQTKQECQAAAECRWKKSTETCNPQTGVMIVPDEDDPLTGVLIVPDEVLLNWQTTTAAPSPEPSMIEAGCSSVATKKECQ